MISPYQEDNLSIMPISLTRHITNVSSDTPSNEPQLSSLPPLRCPSGLFSGRKPYLQDLHTHFIANPSPERKTFLLYGMGGIGKTQICLKFIEENKECFADIFWIDASSENSIRLKLEQIAKAYKISASSSSAKAFLNWISDRGNWLIVFDNADGGHKVVEKFLPQGKKGNILISSRNKGLSRITSPKNSLEVIEMGEEEAISLLLKSSMVDEDSVKAKATAKELVSVLGFIPLAIDQAGGYIQSCGYGLDNYLRLFVKHRAQLMSDKELSGASGYDHSTYGTWDISIEAIKRRACEGPAAQASAAQNALMLHGIFALLHHENISKEMFKCAAGNYLLRKTETTNGLPQSVFLLDSKTLFLDEQDEWDELQFNAGIQTLQSFSLIKCNEKLYSVHPLVHAWSRDRIPQEDRVQMCRRAKALLVLSIKPDYDDDNFALCALLAPHVQAISENMTNFKVQNQYFDDEHIQLAFLFTRIGIWDEAEKLETRVLEARKAKLGNDHPDTISSMNNLANTYRDQGRWDEAEKLETHVLEARKAKLGNDHPDTLGSMNNLASTYRNQGRWDEAEKLETHVLEARKAKLGNDHPDTLGSMNNLAITYSNQGRWDEAEKLETHVLEARKAKLGNDHPDTLGSMNNLANTYSNQGRWDEAEKLETHVLEARKAKLGNDHPDTISSINNLANTYRDQGRWDEAEKLQTHALEASKAKLGNDHPYTISSMNNLANTYRDRGRWDEAEKLQTHVLEASKAKLGNDHPDTLGSMNSLAITYRYQGRWDEAEKLQTHVLEASKAKLGNDHPHTIISMNNLANTYRDQGRWDEAEKLQTHVLEASKAKLGNDHPHTIISMNNLAITYKDQGRWDEAEKLQTHALEKTKVRDSQMNSK
ncbi:hypothetical protein JOM56_011309 [Amanita muscaria]